MSQPYPEAHPLYIAALEADEAFNVELVRVYGMAKAGDARYKARHSDDALNLARDAKMKADMLWLDYMRKG